MTSVHDKAERLDAIRASVRAVGARFGAEYWRALDERREYPSAFVNEMTKAGLLSVLIPTDYEGPGLGITEAALILEEINRAGGNATACHAQMYVMSVLVRHGSAEQRRRYLPEIAAGRLRLQAFAVTEPNSGSDTTALQTAAVRRGDRYVVNGSKIFISRVAQSDLMLLLARTTPRDRVPKKTDGLSLFLVDLRHVKGLSVRPVRTMINHSTNALFFDDVELPAENLVGEEGRGFHCILDGLNAERVLVAAEAVGDGRWFVERATAYARERSVFGRAIGMNQGVQFPIAKAHIAVTGADLMRAQAASLFDSGRACGPEATMAKFGAAEAAWQAANVCMDTFGGYGLATEYDVERKFREVRLYLTAPVSQNLVLAYVGEHVLGLPRSY